MAKAVSYSTQRRVMCNKFVDGKRCTLFAGHRSKCKA